MEIWHYQLHWQRKLTTIKSFKAEASSISPLLGQKLWQRANAWNVSFETLYGDQFTLSTESMIPNTSSYFPTDAAPQFLQKHLPSLFMSEYWLYLWSDNGIQCTINYCYSTVTKLWFKANPLSRMMIVKGLAHNLKYLDQATFDNSL